MKVAILKTPFIPPDSPKDVADADLVVHLSFGRGPALAEHETVAEIMVLRSRFGDPFTRDFILDLSHVDPESASARAKRRDEEVAAAVEILRRHGHVVQPSGLVGHLVVTNAPGAVIDNATMPSYPVGPVSFAVAPRPPPTKPKMLDGASEGDDEPIGFRPPTKTVSYEGDPCGACGQFMVVRTGTCRTCQGCGNNDGC